MPITPFHLGPGWLLTELTGASFAAFTLANVVIDVESVYHVLAGIYPVHTFLHTVLGSTIVAVAVSLALVGFQVLAGRPRRPIAVVAGAFAGAWSHVLLDGIMHADMRPLAPWSEANPLFRLISLLWLHAFCTVTALLAAWLFLRKRRT